VDGAADVDGAEVDEVDEPLVVGAVDGVDAVVTASVAGWSIEFSRLAQPHAAELDVTAAKEYVPLPAMAAVTLAEA
jgi:hypothetical protein